MISKLDGVTPDNLLYRTLEMMVSMIDDNIVDKQVKTEWLSHRELERGNPVLIFVGDKFKVK